jgi:hypothetical protein
VHGRKQAAITSTPIRNIPSHHSPACPWLGPRGPTQRGHSTHSNVTSPLQTPTRHSARVLTPYPPPRPDSTGGLDPSSKSEPGDHPPGFYLLPFTFQTIPGTPTAVERTPEAPDNRSLGTASIIEETPPPEPRETPPPLPIDYECAVSRIGSPIEPRHPLVEIPEPAPCRPQPRPYRHPRFCIYQQVRR